MRIVFEGPDGCGKSTLMRDVALELADRGYKVNSITPMELTTLGTYLRTMIGTEKPDPYRTALLYIANYLEVDAILNRMNEPDTIVLMDRWLLSTLTYIKVKCDEIRFKSKFVESMIFTITNNTTKIDKTIYVCTSIDERRRRMQVRDGDNVDMYSDFNTQIEIGNLYEYYITQFEKESKITESKNQLTGDVYRVDGLKTLDVLTNEVCNIILHDKDN